MNTTVRTILISLLIVGLGTGIWFCDHAAKHADKIMNDALVNYEDFQEMYNAAKKVNTDLGTIRELPPNDKMFDQFSKNSMIVQKKQLLNRWVEEYNAKSKMWNRGEKI